MGGMAAFTPGATAERRAEQTAKVVEDKRFEAALGHDGCWVSHPYFIGPALAAFEHPNQLDVIPEIPEHPDLLPQGAGPRTLAGLRTNVRVGIAYMKGWNEEIGCVAWDDLMEDLATLEISRAQTWQWLRHGVEPSTTARRSPASWWRGSSTKSWPGSPPRSAPARRRGRPERQIAAFARAQADARDLFTAKRVPTVSRPALGAGAGPGSAAHRLRRARHQPTKRGDPDGRDGDSHDWNATGRTTRAGRGSSAPTAPPTSCACAARRHRAHPGAARRREAVELAARPRRSSTRSAR